MKKFLAVALALVLCLSLAACGGSGDSSDEAPDETPAESVKLTVAASPTPHAVILEQCVSILAEQGIELVVNEYGDYVIPNTAVEDGEEDANYFQHIPYLDDFNAERGTHLVSVAGVHVEPMGIYAGKTSSLEELPDGAVIAVPNDADDGAAGARNTTNFAARERDLRPVFFASDERRFRTGATAHAAAATRTKFDVVDFGTERNLVQREAVPDARFGGGAAVKRHTDGNAFRSDDIAFFAVGVDQERDTSGTVRVVLNRGDARRNPVLITTEVDQTELTFVAAAAMANGNNALIVATVATTLRTEKAFFRLRAFRQLGKVADAHISPTRVIRFVSSNTHYVNLAIILR